MKRKFDRVVRLSLVAAALTAGLIFGGLHRTAASAEPDGPTADQVIASMHEAMTAIQSEVGVFDDAQKAKVADLEKALTDELKADPKKGMDRAFQQASLNKLWDVMTTDQQKKFDALTKVQKARAAQVLTTSNLKQIGLAYIMYANDNKGAAAPTLGDLLKYVGGPGVFLVPDSTTRAPENWKDLDNKAKADWVNKNAEYVYIPSKEKSPDAITVAGYVKPELAKAGNAFLLTDGSVRTKTADESTKIIDELNAGKNPPPSLE